MAYYDEQQQQGDENNEVITIIINTNFYYYIEGTRSTSSSEMDADHAGEFHLLDSDRLLGSSLRERTLKSLSDLLSSSPWLW